MIEKKCQEIIKSIELFPITNSEQLETFRLNYLTKKGPIQELMTFLKTADSEQKRDLGLKINQVKQIAELKFNENSLKFKKSSINNPKIIDFTLNDYNSNIGSRHPLQLTLNKIISIFSKMGFSVSNGPEIEDDWHNFSALNFPPEHPARDMQDTFFINSEYALRTHTSSVQVRLMENNNPPIRSLMPGRVYRNEAVSARANCFFHQIEGLYINKNVSFADLKFTLFEFVKTFFNSDIKVRFRPSYFPFTEPSAEMDISCQICKGKGCNICKQSGWVEILGCGMVDPQVLSNCNIDSSIYSGFAFGMGIERITMLQYNINDLRLFFENNIKFTNQFISDR